MSVLLNEAIAAARAGESERAQLIAADAVRANPDDPNGWYLLSQLVESDSRRAVYLAKTLSLDPNHPRAREAYDNLPPDLLAAMGAAGQPAATLAPEITEAAAAVEVPVEVVAAEVEPVPALMPETAISEEPVAPELAGVGGPVAMAGEPTTWLETVNPTPIGTGIPVSATIPIAAAVDYKSPPPAPERRAQRPRSANQALSILLGILMLLALVVLGMLAYFIFL
jgi:hypothetical protein